MFILLRSIRQKLFMTTNYKKYFFYGLGEISLVVIGILIALQIDNWNEQRIKNNQEQVNISNLNSEFQKNLIGLEKAIVEITGVRKALKSILLEISEPQIDFSDEQVNTLINNSFTSPSWNSSSFVLEDLKNTGNLSGISKNELKQLLFSWERLDDSLNIIAEDYTFFAREYFLYVTKHGSIRNVDALREKFQIEKSNLDISNIPLLKSPEFENTVGNFYALTSSMLTSYLKAKQKMSQIIVATDS